MFRCICMEMKLFEMCIVLSRPDEANWQLVELAASPWYLVFVKILKFICMNLKSICLEIEIVVKCIGAKQVRCRRLATGRAGRLSLAPKPPAAPTHSLGFYSPPGFAQIFIFRFLYLCISIFLHCMQWCHENPTFENIICLFFGKHIVFIGVSMNLNMSFSWFSQTARLTRTSAIHLSA